jgi:hypothetical protein
MVTVPRSSLDPAKVITEHDLLKFVGTLATTLLIPLAMWGFYGINTKVNTLVDNVHKLDVQVAVLQSQLRQHHDYTAAEFDATKTQIRAVGQVVNDLTSNAKLLVKIVSEKPVAKPTKRK